jgi:ribosomal protein L7/L12
VSDRDLFEAQQRIAMLERKVADLYQRIGKDEPQWGFGDDDGTGAADADPEIIRLIQAGQEIQAIKRYRELTGQGLKEATDAVRMLDRQYGPIDPHRG